MIEKISVYVLEFFCPLLLTLLLTPLVREVNRALGLVDKPDARRINKVPVPRGGGVALVFGIFVPAIVICHFTGRELVMGEDAATTWKMVGLSVAMATLGYLDDFFSLRPWVKLLGQIVLAFLVWSWIGLGFGDLWPTLPAWFDCLLTVFWIVGAVNAFNLIDGMDGLASGIALIATVGMVGALFFAQTPGASLLYFAVAGGLVGFLFYNFNPASVFLGDSGSMFLGFLISTLSLVSHTPDSFLVSVGLPLLAMGVPIFDTSLAIVRRSIRRLLSGSEASGGHVMQADSDHLHHRILRSVGMNQRHAAWLLYALATGVVAVGLVAICLKSRAAGLWLAAVAVAAVIVVRDMAKVELYDAGRLLGTLAHDPHREPIRLERLSVPFYIVIDLLLLVGVFYLCVWLIVQATYDRSLMVAALIRTAATFGALVFFRTYHTLWSRALPSNYVRLLAACVVGSVVGSVVLYYAPSVATPLLPTVTVFYAITCFMVLSIMRLSRGLVRDAFYALDCGRLSRRKDISRIFAYGAGLRYRFFRRELVRSTAANDRMIVGLLDDNHILHGKFIGGIRVLGAMEDLPELINAFNVDAVVVTCVLSPERRAELKACLSPLKVKLTYFSFNEQEV